MAYILFVLFAFLCCYAFVEEDLSERTKVGMLFALGLVMAFVAGLRPDGIDHDYNTYVDMYYRSFSMTTEPTFLLIVSFVQFVCDDVVLMFLIYALLTMLVLVRAIDKLTSLRALSLMYYLATFYLLHGMNQIRVAVAAGIFLLALPHLLDGNRKKYMLYIFFAILFHYSAVVLLFLAVFNGKPLKKWHVYLLALSVPAAYLIYFLKINLFVAVPIPYFEEKMMAYQRLQDSGGQWDEINVFNLVFLARIAMFYFLLWKNRLVTEGNKYAAMLLKIEALAIFSFVSLYVIPVLAIRLSELFAIVEVVLFPLLFYTLKPARYGRLLVIGISVTLLLINLYYNKYIEV